MLNVTPEAIKNFYMELWGTGPDIAIPFAHTLLNIHEAPADEIFCAITKKEIKELFNQLKMGVPQD